MEKRASGMPRRFRPAVYFNITNDRRHAGQIVPEGTRGEFRNCRVAAYALAIRNSRLAAHEMRDNAPHVPKNYGRTERVPPQYRQIVTFQRMLLNRRAYVNFGKPSAHCADNRAIGVVSSRFYLSVQIRQNTRYATGSGRSLSIHSPFA